MNILLTLGDIADKIPPAPHFNNYLNNPVESKFSFHTITENKVSSIINKLKNKISYGYDSISNIMLKKAHDPLIRPVTQSNLIYSYISKIVKNVTNKAII